ncbi:myotubularin-related protein 12-like [Ornithodoros turicata]
MQQLGNDSFPFRLTARRNVLQVSPATEESNNMSSSLRLRRTGGSFVSYIDLDDSPTAQRASSQTEVWESPVSLTPELLEDEVVVSEVNNVLKFNTLSDLRNGVSGVLFCTSFRLSFVTMQQIAPTRSLNLCANRMLNENDISLLNIDTVYQISGGRRKRLSSGGSPPEIVQIHCKDLRVFTFSFKFCAQEQSAKAVQYLFRYAFVSNTDLLFSFRGKAGPREPLSVFESTAEWEAEINRCQCTRFRVTDINKKYGFSHSLPRRFVVPKQLLDCQLQSLSPHFFHHRVVMWCWSSHKGAALLKASASDTTSDTGESDRYSHFVRCLGPEIQLVNLDLECPVVKEIGSSFSRLQALCVPTTESEFKDQETHFHGNLEATRWLECLSGCLRVAVTAAKGISHYSRHVIVKERTGYDMTCVVTSLVQVLLDPHCRTQQGFQTLIDKEWVAGGHPFAERHAHLRTMDPKSESAPRSEMVPIFLFFLDCVWQLQAQFPTMFEFSETYLTTLWDCAHVGVYDAFLFNCNRERNKAKKSRVFRNVWDWTGPTSRLTVQDLELFKNPLYILNKAEEYLNHGTTAEHAGAGDAIGASDDLLSADYTIKALSVWTQCYFRWIPKAEVVNGDPATLFLHNVRVSRDIQFLASKIRALQEGMKGVQLRHRRMPSDEYIFAAQRNSVRAVSQEGHVITSSFPFAPSGPVDWGTAHIPSIAPLPNFGEGYDDLDD